MIQDILHKAKAIHFVGIGGIGMSGLARILSEKGKQISGSDLHQNTQTDTLTQEGLQISIGHNASNIKDPELVIYSLAIPESNIELQTALEKGIPIMTYPQALGILTQDYKLIAIAGTHGKTTTTAMLGQILLEAGLDPTILVGSTTKFLNNKNSRTGKSEYFILEACEYHQGFLNLYPDITIITNIEHDHFDAYPTPKAYINAFQHLADQTKDIIILNTDFELSHKLTFKNQQVVRYSNPNPKIRLQIPGVHNLKNATAALHAATEIQIPQVKSLETLLRFEGTARRLEIISQTETQTIYSDYAHHPTEIKATLQALKSAHPDKKICVIFQPHQFSRTIALLDDFKSAFTQADKVLVPNIYRARDTESDATSMPASLFAETIGATFTQSLENTKQNFTELTHGYEIVVIMGAGDVNLLIDKSTFNRNN